MPLTLDDDTALLVVRAMLKAPPTSGAVIISLLQSMQRTQTDQGKLIQQLTEKVDTMSQTTQQAEQDFESELAGIRDDMSKQTTATNSMAVFVAGIKDKLTEALARPDPAAALAAVKQLHTDLNTNTAAIIAASTENTAAAAEPAQPVQPTTTVDTGSVQAAVDDTGTASAADTSGAGTGAGTLPNA